jgi:hypothetical protein
MKTPIVILIILVLVAAAFAQYAPRSFAISGNARLDNGTPEPRLLSNVIIDIKAIPHVAEGEPAFMWLGTGNGLTRVSNDLMPPIGDIQFLTYTQSDGLGKGGTSALVVTDSIIWSAFAFDTTVGVSGAGGGLAYSRNGGGTWIFVPQPRDRRYDIDANGYDRVLGYYPTTTNVDNITYDIALSDSFVWTVSKGGGIRYHRFAADYTDYNDTTGWRVVSPLRLEDGRNLTFHPGDPTEGLIHRAFSVLYAESTLFVGTADGILRSTNNGRQWRNIVSTTNGISGNFVTALGYQETTRTIWAATWRAEGASEFYGVSKSTDGGATWHALLDSMQVVRAIGHSETPHVHSFAFDGNVVYACDDLGLWKSTDGGATWDLYTAFVEAETGHRFYEPQIYAAQVIGSTLFAGGTDGLASTRDEGLTWKLYQAAKPLGEPPRAVDTYAYPCPWSPQRFGPVKLRYTTTGGSIKVLIYDFAMSKVVELPASARPAGEQYEVWDGTKNGKIVANGTYFYKIEKPGGEVWGKLIVLD